MGSRARVVLRQHDRIDILLERTIPALLSQIPAEIEVSVVRDETPAPQLARL